MAYDEHPRPFHMDLPPPRPPRPVLIEYPIFAFKEKK